MFGTLQPSTDGEPSACRTECLVAGNETTRLEVRVRFLQPVQRLDPDGAWEEAVEREAILEGRALAELATAEQTAFDFPGGEETDGRIVRRRRPLRVAVERRAAALGGGVFRVSVAVANATVPAPRARPEDSRLAVVASAQTLLGVEDGRFVSLLDPPAALAETAAASTLPACVSAPGCACTRVAGRTSWTWCWPAARRRSRRSSRTSRAASSSWSRSTTIPAATSARAARWPTASSSSLMKSSCWCEATRAGRGHRQRLPRRRWLRGRRRAAPSRARRPGGRRRRGRRHSRLRPGLCAARGLRRGDPRRHGPPRRPAGHAVFARRRPGG